MNDDEPGPIPGDIVLKFSFKHLLGCLKPSKRRIAL